tara:strand:- start:1136 stop:1249 length:114 start_codon:yes stop_codon:yes gene_type:complete
VNPNGKEYMIMMIGIAVNYVKNGGVPGVIFMLGNALV